MNGSSNMILILVLLFVTSCSNSSVSGDDEADISSPEDLVAHSEEFRKEIVKVTDRIYVAVGFGLANSIMIEGENGLIIIDAMESMKEGQAVIDAFRQISEKPVSAIIYTHNHTDHVFGAKAIAGNRSLVEAESADLLEARLRSLLGNLPGIVLWPVF